jgi:Uma2 family endonuclease
VNRVTLSQNAFSPFKASGDEEPAQISAALVHRGLDEFRLHAGRNAEVDPSLSDLWNTCHASLYGIWKTEPGSARRYIVAALNWRVLCGAAYLERMAISDLTVRPEGAGTVIIALAARVTEETLIELSTKNPDYRFETMADGQLVVIPLTGTESSLGEGELHFQVHRWNQEHRLGFVTPSSGGITLADGAIKGPDTTFISGRRMAEASPEPKKQRAFKQIAPDVVFELLSPSDELQYTVSKCEEYVATGSDVAVLLNPRNRSVTMYRRNDERQIAPDIAAVRIGDEMPGFLLSAQAVFDAGKDFV